MPEPTEKPLRLTKRVRQQLLDHNDGFETETSYRSRNFSEDRRYSISGGELHIRATSNSSWADSRSTQEWVADENQTRRFLKDVLDRLDTEGL